MPRYKVVRKIPAVYTELYHVDAGSEEEALSRVEGGIARCKVRAFRSTPGEAQPHGFQNVVHAESEPITEDTLLFPEGMQPIQETFNTVFEGTPGGVSFKVVQQDG